jgi:hypothetical protein
MFVISQLSQDGRQPASIRMHNMSMTEAFGSRVSLFLVVRERPFSIFTGDRVGALRCKVNVSALAPRLSFASLIRHFAPLANNHLIKSLTD